MQIDPRTVYEILRRWIAEGVPGLDDESHARTGPRKTGCPLGRYGEAGLAKEHAAVWLYAEALTIEFADEPLAQYRVRYQPDKEHLLTVAEPVLFEMPYRSAQLPLWELSDTEWLKVVRRPDYAPRVARPQTIAQSTLFALDVS